MLNYSRHLRGFAVAALLAVLSASALAGDKVHKIVFHLDESNPKRMNLVLNNASNVIKYYQNKGEEVEVEIVSYGPGLIMLHAKKSPVKDRIKSFSQNYDNVSFKACGNTLRKMTKKAGKPVKLLPQAQMVPSGVVHLVTRQEEGWSYIRP